MDPITEFVDDYFFLSNFYDAPVCYEGLNFFNNEAAFQAQKCVNPSDRSLFCDLNPSQAKKLGRSINLRKDWEQIKFGVMSDIVRCKFTQNPDLADKLLATGDAYLEEGNTWGDRVWGTVNGSGRNLLGQILMTVREELRLSREQGLT